MKNLDALAGGSGPDIKKTFIGGIGSILACIISIWLLNKEISNFREL